MTDRKPPSVPVNDWIEQRIRAAQEQGDFENLPGFGKPIPDIDEPFREGRWVAEKLKRENVNASALLPPALALAKELEDLPVRLQSLHTEEMVRKVVTDLNERVLQMLRRPPAGPLVQIELVDVDAVVGEWRTNR